MKTITPKILANLIPFLLFAFFQLPFTKGNTITDLDSNTLSGFTSQAASWSSTALSTGKKVSSCWGLFIMGGYDVLDSGTGYFYKTFSGLSTPHNTVCFTMKAFQIDSWDGADAFTVNLDGYVLNGWQFPRPAAWVADACGGSWAEIPPVLVRATIPHTGGTFYVQVKSEFNQGSTDESFGFREITLTTDTTSSPSFSYCGVTAGNYLPNNWCTCESNQYMTYPQSGLCTDCYSNCATCSGSATACTSCHTDWFLVGTTCYPSCNSPLYSSESSGVISCKTPCQGQYVYWDGSCGPSCAYSTTSETFSVTPSVENTFSRCDYPCPGTNKFLSWNNTCLDTCPEPLKTLSYKSRNFCSFPCADTTQYLYWNKSCISTCPSPLISEVQGNPIQRKFCWYPCQLNQFVLSDGSCYDSCHPGYFEIKDLHSCEPCQDSLCAVCDASFGVKCQQCKGQNILDSDDVCQDCQALKNEFLKQNDETFTYQYKLKLLPASCDLDETTVRQYLSPTQDSKNLFPQFLFQVNHTQDSTGAKYFLLEIQFKSSISSNSILSFTLSSLKTDLQVPKTPTATQSADKEVKATFAAITGSTIGAGLILGATAALWSIISFQQFIGYFIYLNVQLPPHLIYFLTMFDDVSLEILPNPLASITDRLAELWDSLVNNTDKKYQLPNKFTEFDTPTLFVINAGSTFFVCPIFLLIPYWFDLLRKIKRIERIKFIQNLHSNLRWNVLIRVFLESGIPLTFALLIQMRKISYSNVPYGISTITASLAFIYLGMMINYISQTLRDFKYEDLKNPSVENSIGTLFEGLVLKKEKPSGKYYYLLILFRGMLLVSVDVLADQFPIVQTTVMAVFHICFVYFVWKVIKFESRYLNWTNRIKEVLILISEIFFMTLCYPQNEKYRNIVGWLIISMLGLTLVMELLFGFYLQVLAVRDFVKRIREFFRKKKKKLVIAPVKTEETSRSFTIVETEIESKK